MPGIAGLTGGENFAEYLIMITSDTTGAIKAQQALQQMSTDAQAAAAKQGKAYQVLGQQFSTSVKATENQAIITTKLTEKTKEHSGALGQRVYNEQQVIDRTGTLITQEQRAAGATIKHTKATQGLIGGYMKLAARAIAVIPIWMALRLVYQGVFGSISSLIRTFMDLSKEMGRVAGVTRGQEEDLKLLRDAVIDYSATASRGFKEAASAMYALGSAGLSVTEQLAGMEHIMNVAIGTFGDVEQIAKLVAGSYNVFGASLENAYTSAEKMKQISDILAYTYSTQQVELSEISNAMTYVASVAGLLDIEFEELVATIGVLNTGMLKGSKAGTALMNAFVRLAQKGEGLEKLGVIFDPAQPLDFLDVMTQLHKKYGDTALSVTSLAEIMQVFGRRGGRAAAQLIHDFDRWQRSMDDTRKNFEDFAEYMREQAEDTLPGAFAKLGNAIKAMTVGLLEERGVKGAIARLAEYIELIGRAREFKEFIPEELRPKLIYTPITGGALYTFPDKQRLQDLLETNKDIYLIMKQVRGEIERQAKGIEESADTSDRLKEIHKTYRDTIAEGGDLQEAEKTRWNDILALVQNISGEKGKDLTFVVAVTRKLLEQHDLTEKIAEANRRLTIAQQDRLKDMDREHRYELMRLQGFRETTILQREASDILDEINKKIDARIKQEKESTKEKKDQAILDMEHLTLEDIMLNNMDKLHLAGSSVLGAWKQILEVKKKTLAITEDLAKMTADYANQLKSAFSDVFGDILRGEEGLENMFMRMGEAWRGIQIEAFAEGLSEWMVGPEGLNLGEFFGFSTAKLRTAFEKTGNVFVDSIVEGSVKGSARMEEAIIRAGARVARIWGIGVGGIGGYGGAFGMPGFGGYGTGGFMNLPVFGGGVGGAGGFGLGIGGGMGRNIGGGAGMRTRQPLPYGQILGLAASTMMAAQGGGGWGTVAGAMGGLGMLGMGAGMLQAGASAGSLFGAGGMLGASWLGPVGFALTIGSMLLGMFQGAPKWRREETRTQTQQITSRIDVSNRQLEWVNRNLVALRQELTYIMQESYYFRERTEPEKFAIGSMRGIS